MNDKALYNLSYGVYVITSLEGTRPVGCVANSVMQVTSAPATVAVSMNHDNFTHSAINASGLFAVNILNEDADPGTIGNFGFRSCRDCEKFDDGDFTLRGDLPIINDCGSYVICQVIDQLDTYTHTIFLGKVIDADIRRPGTPMTYAYYHNVIKGTSPKNAPTYRGETAAVPGPAVSPARWVCTVCGYVYDGDTPFEELPDSYVCPICKQPKAKFEKR